MAGEKTCNNVLPQGVTSDFYYRTHINVWRDAKARGLPCLEPATLQALWTEFLPPVVISKRLNLFHYTFTPVTLK